MAATDYERAWLRLGAYVAGRPNHRRQDLLVVMAEIVSGEEVPEDEFDRALRLVLPQLAEMLFNRTALDPGAAERDESALHVDRDHLSIAAPAAREENHEHRDRAGAAA
ncbi:MAG TPA: hypothetical protein VK631_04105 [Solirubrobacteraceae bacterium]|nr:hypothetical protein [Solirubrobacteraceae bacterium]